MLDKSCLRQPRYTESELGSNAKKPYWVANGQLTGRKLTSLLRSSSLYRLPLALSFRRPGHLPMLQLRSFGVTVVAFTASAGHPSSFIAFAFGPLTRP